MDVSSGPSKNRSHQLSGFALSQLYTENRGALYVDIAILFLLIGLALLAPLPFGSVLPLPLFFIEIAALLSFILWAIKLVFFADSEELRFFRALFKNEQDARRKAPFFVRNPLIARLCRIFSVGRYPRKYEASHLIENSANTIPSRLSYFSVLGYPVRNTGIESLFLIFLALLLFQTLPLPAFLVRLLSPSSFHLYSGANLHASPFFLSLSVDWFATFSKICEYTAYFFLYLVVVNIATKRAHFWSLFLTLILSATFQSFYGLYEALAGRGEIFGYQKLNHVHVASGTFINSNHYASYVSILLALILSLTAKILTETRLSGSTFAAAIARLFQVRGSQLLLLFGIILLCTAAIVFSRSRACVLIAILSCAIFISLYWRANREIPGKLYWLSAMVGTVFIAVWLGVGPLMKKFGDLPEDLTSDTGRRQVSIDTARMFLSFPLTGSGAGTYGQTFPVYQTVYHSAYSHAHNDFLEVLAENGFLAALLSIVAFSRMVGRMAGMINRRLEGLLVLQVGAGCSFLTAILTALVHFTFQIPAICVTASLTAALFFLNFEKKLSGGKEPSNRVEA